MSFFIHPKRTLLLMATLVMAVSLIGQNQQRPEETEKTDQKKERTEKVKQGWNIGGLPVVSFDSDLGFQFGALANLYHYGDGSRYPFYNHSLYFEASWYTKGSGIFRFYYDSDRLIRGIRTSVDISYMPDQAFYFYGYNGYGSVYNDAWVDEDTEDYKTRLFYRYRREFFRFKADFQGDIIKKKFFWLAGLDFYNIYTSPIDRKKFDIADTTGTLFDQYKAWNIIPESYAQTIMYYSRMTGAYNEGLGGVKTLRGISRNRVLGDGWVMGNFELRYRFLYFQWIKQNWYLALSGFFDTGRTLSLIDVEGVVKDENNNISYPEGESEQDYFDFGNDRFHNSVGAGLYVAMNQNFIIAINFGKALDEQDGNTGFYIGINFLF
ncbi:MAG: hypothetical protein P8100_07960 [bacterium]